MVDWLYIGYCTVMAMFAVAAAYAAVVGLRALRRLPRSLMVGVVTAAIVATLTAQKTNNVPPNMNQPQMQPGGGSLTGLTGLVGIGNLISLVNSVQTTIDDIMRGWRVESVATNAAVSYAMPTNATLVGNWHLHGAAHQTYACRPVTISASDGNPFTMSVVPLNLGGVFLWLAAQRRCSINGSGDTFTWNCPMNCTCCGCTVEGQYSYEGYWLPATSCLCGCYYDGTGPKWEPSSAPLAASVSALFSKSAVIFEDAYENLPGQLVEKRSERTRLNIVAHGGPNGASLSVAVTNLSKLSHISGPGLPLADVAIPANTSVSYAIVYEGNEASLSTNDIVVSAEIADNVTSEGQDSHTELTCIRVIIQEEDIAPAGVCTNRHTYGVGETMRMLTVPAPPGITWSADHGSVVPLRFTFPFSSDESVRIDKCGHWVSRALGGEIQKDGVVQ